MLKKLAIGSGISIVTIIAIGMLFVSPTTIEEKNPGLIPPGVNIYDMIGLEEINASTPNKITDRDLGPFEEKYSTAEPNKIFIRYNSISSVIEDKPAIVKILADKDGTRTTILISKKDIPSDTTNIGFLYKDNGVIISIYEREPNVPDNIFSQNLKPGYKVVTINGYEAVIRSVSQQIESDVVTDIPLSLEMLSDKNQISIIGFISDEQAIKYAEYITRK